MAKNVVDITSTQTPATDTSFSEQKINANSGPTPVLPPGVSLESNGVQPTKPKSAAIWSPIEKFDDSLKAALIDFVDTTMEGVKYPKDFRGRTKAIDFFFYGTATKSIRPAEVGHFRLVFGYPPNITNVNNTINETATT